MISNKVKVFILMFLWVFPLENSLGFDTNRTLSQFKHSHYTGEKLSFNFEDTDVRAVLTFIADFTELNMIISDTVSGKITLHLQDVPWDEALDVILKTKGLTKRKVDNVLWIGMMEEVSNREKWEWQFQKQNEDLAVLKMEQICVNHAKANAIAALLKSDKSTFLSSRGVVSVDERTNSLLILDTTDKLTEIKKFIEKLDVPLRQVLIESRIVFVMDDIEKALGITLSTISSQENENRETSQALSPLENRFNIHLPVTLSSNVTNMARLGFTFGKLQEECYWIWS